MLVLISFQTLLSGHLSFLFPLLLVGVCGHPELSVLGGLLRLFLLVQPVCTLVGNSLRCGIVGSRGYVCPVLVDFSRLYPVFQSGPWAPYWNFSYVDIYGPFFSLYPFLWIYSSTSFGF